MFGIKRKKAVQPEPIPQPMQSRPVIRTVPQMTTLARSSVGNRNYQQDALYVSESKVLSANKKIRLLAVVCDGMGGMADGGKASRTAIQMMVQGLKISKKHHRSIYRHFFSRESMRSIR